MTNPRRLGFTLIEVLVSMGLFSFVIVAGSVAVTTLLSHQEESYAATRAASLAMRAANLYMQQANAAAGYLPLWNSGNTGFFRLATTPPSNTNSADRWAGGTLNDRKTGGSWYYVNPTTPNAADYDNLLVYLSTEVEETADKEYLSYAYMTVWMGATENYTVTTNTLQRKLRFLGRYVVATKVNRSR